MDSIYTERQRDGDCFILIVYHVIAVALFCEQSLSCGIEQTIVWQERCVESNDHNQIKSEVISNNTENHGDEEKIETETTANRRDDRLTETETGIK